MQIWSHLSFKAAFLSQGLMPMHVCACKISGDKHCHKFLHRSSKRPGQFPHLKIDESLLVWIKGLHLPPKTHTKSRKHLYTQLESTLSGLLTLACCVQNPSPSSQVHQSLVEIVGKLQKIVLLLCNLNFVTLSLNCHDYLTDGSATVLPDNFQWTSSITIWVSYGTHLGRNTIHVL